MRGDSLDSLNSGTLALINEQAIEENARRRQSILEGNYSWTRLESIGLLSK
jgi:hypothetical protein